MMMQGYELEAAVPFIAKAMRKAGHKEPQDVLEDFIRRAIEADMAYMREIDVIDEDGLMGDGEYADDDAFEALLDVLGEEFDGVLGCDYFSAYHKYMKTFNITVQFCIAHLIRVMDLDQPQQFICRSIIRCAQRDTTPTIPLFIGDRKGCFPLVNIQGKVSGCGIQLLLRRSIGYGDAGQDLRRRKGHLLRIILWLSAAP